jgi:hypothetical protein
VGEMSWVRASGDCAGDIDNFCEKVNAGVKRLANCLSKQLEEEEKGNVQGDLPPCAADSSIVIVVPQV